jgi:site-specific DNA-methyltransferase (adenine-specific)
MAKVLKERPDLAKKVQHLPFMAAIREVKNLQVVEQTTRLHEQGQIQLSADIRKGSCLDLIKELPNDSVHCVVTDPPFGNSQIEDAEGTTRGENLSYTGTLEPSDNLSLDEAIRLVEQLAPELYRTLKPGGYFYVFHSSDLYEPLRRALAAAGFYVDPTPIVWYKGRTTTIFTGYNYQSSYEPILYGYKPIDGAKARRLNKGISNLIEVPSLHASKKTHPFEKPMQLIRMLIENSTVIGDMVLDPFSGSGKTVLTAKSCGRSALGFELSEKNFVRSQAKLLMGETIEETTAKKKVKTKS